MVQTKGQVFRHSRRRRAVQQEGTTVHALSLNDDAKVSRIRAQDLVSEKKKMHEEGAAAEGKTSIRKKELWAQKAQLPK